MPDVKYCAVGIYPSGQDAAVLLAVNGRVILFDTKAIAQQVLPLLGGGRRSRWSADGERLMFSPMDPKGVNRLVILTGWDPYDVSSNVPGQVRSETRSMEWKHHIMWSHWLTDCGGNLVKAADGSVVNTAVGEVRA